ncbi:MAG TPA: glutamate 5-kinase, partial [Clostridia bacterium]|nr:glutamate 5-kinase [Clostridia bacterium]
MNNERKHLCYAKRIVIKIGTSTLTYETGKINFTRIDKLARTVSDIMNQGKE